MSKPFVKPGFMRYRRVNDILTKDASLNSMMSARDQIVLKPDGQKEHYSREVIAVTDQLAERGIDPQHASRQLIMQTAVAVFKIGAGRKPQVSKPVAVKVAKAKKVVAPKVPVTPKAQTRKTARPATPEPPAAVASRVSTPAPMSSISTNELFDGEPITSLNERAVLPPGLMGQSPDVKKLFASIQVGWSQLLMALTVLEKKDRLPGWEVRIRKLSELTEEYGKLNVIESSCAQENQAPDGAVQTTR